jgi:hypothetical protein
MARFTASVHSPCPGRRLTAEAVGSEVLDAGPGHSPLVIAAVVNESVAAKRGQHIGDGTGGRCR